MSFIVRRLAFYLVAFLVAATFNFLIPRLMPGNPADIMLANSGGTIPVEARDALMATFGFIDAPLHQQYLTYLGSIFTWDFGISVKFYPVPVADILGRALPWTILLTGSALIVSFSIGTVLGILVAWRRGAIGRCDPVAHGAGHSIHPVSGCSPVRALSFCYLKQMAADRLCL